MSNRLKLTSDAIRRRCAPVGKDEVDERGRPVRRRMFWDADLPGFGLVVGRRDRSFIAQKDIAGRTVRVTIGKFPQWTPEMARKEARQLLAQMDRGEDPNAERRAAEAARVEAQRVEEWRAFTLREAIEEHAANMRAEGCVQRSIASMRDELGRHLSAWMDEPLVGITRARCIDRHREVTEENGPTAANRAFRHLRACWNSARGRYEEMPEHPVGRARGNRKFPWNKTRRRREPVAWGDLPAYWAAVEALENPVRRDLRHVLLLTGLRSLDARTIRWEHIDFDAGTLHRPTPKGGADRAFTVPLSAHVLGLLARRKLDNLRWFSSDGGWAFPTRDRSGSVTHVQEAKEQRYERREDGTYAKVGSLPSPHRLRDTFATACREAGVGMMETKALMNHRLPEEDVTEGYIRLSEEHLRGCQERVTAFLLEKANARQASERARA